MSQFFKEWAGSEEGVTTPIVTNYHNSFLIMNVFLISEK